MKLQEKINKFDVTRIRADFPALAECIHKEKPLVYLDNAATTQKPRAVIDAIKNYYEHSNANVHRALHELASRATLGYEACRTQVARFINAPNAETVVFTHGTTESINLIAHAWGRKFIEPGDEIILSEMEHHSNLIPWQLLAQEKRASLRFIPVLDDGTLDLNIYHRILSQKTKLVAISHMSNVLGTVNPVSDIAASAHEVNAVVAVDGAQSAAHMPVDVEFLNCDFFSFSGHKMCGPTGLGVLYAKPERLMEMDPFMGGGEMILKVGWKDSSWAEPPHKFEAGTPNIAGVFGLSAALTYLSTVGMQAIKDYERELTDYTMNALNTIRGLRIFGQAKQRGGIVSFELDGVHPHDVAQFVDCEGVAIRAGHHCAQPLMRKLGVTATSRISLYMYNEKREIEILLEALQKARDFFSTSKRCACGIS